MVNGSQVRSDASKLSTYGSEYTTTINGLSSSWQGASHDKLVEKSEQFTAEYFDVIPKQMESFASACDAYEEYKNYKQNLEINNTKYQEAVTSNNTTDANTFLTEIRNIENQMNTLKSQIENSLKSASTPKLEAQNNTYDFDEILEITKTKEKQTSNLDMTNYPKGDSYEDGLARSILVAQYLVEKGGFTKEQAAALVGVYLDENNCDPGEVMQAEKDGYGAEGTGGNNYGAGIGSWTFNKESSLEAAGFDPNTPIESLTLQQQCDMIIAESQSEDHKYYYDALRRCETLEDASATAVVMIGAPGFSDNWDTHPTPAEAKEVSDWYGASNDANYGASEYHWNLDVRRLENAQKIYENM